MTLFLLRNIWIFPLTVHISYIAATSRYLPPFIGDNIGWSYTRAFFILEWSGIVLFSVLCLLGVRWKLPSFSDKVLSVPNKEYWMQSTHNKSRLINKLRGLIETALFFCNIFLLGIYQWVYQSNVMVPVLKFPLLVLISAFVLFPLIAIVFQMFVTIRWLKKIPSI